MTANLDSVRDSETKVYNNSLLAKCNSEKVNTSLNGPFMSRTNISTFLV